MTTVCFYIGFTLFCHTSQPVWSQMIPPPGQEAQPLAPFGQPQPIPQPPIWGQPAPPEPTPTPTPTPSWGTEGDSSDE
jgi:hypothetical protein